MTNIVKNNMFCPYILFFGRISPYKGVDILLNSMLKVHQMYPNCKLVVAGGGKFSFDTSFYKDLDYIDIKNYFHSVSELASLIQNAKFVVCPYIDATQSGVIMSSYTFCKPVIATKVGALHESVEHMRTGLLIEPNDINALSSAIELLLSDNDLLKAMENNIRDIYWNKGKYSWEKISEQIYSIYEIVKNGKKG